MLTLRHALCAALLPALASCGDHDTTGGFADPCQTAMAGVLGCPARSGYPGEASFTAADACRKLVSCGILAATNYKVSGSTRPCNADSDCAASTGEACRKASDGRLWCHAPMLDQRWCHVRLTQGTTDPCNKSQPYSTQIINNALQCIADTNCEALGLPFSHKTLPVDSRPRLDLYTCDNNKSHIWTASACDHGLLRY